MRIGFDGKVPWADEAVKRAGVTRTPAPAAMRRRRVDLKVVLSMICENPNRTLSLHRL
jgi:hypothetical protein